MRPDLIIYFYFVNTLVVVADGKMCILRLSFFFAVFLSQHLATPQTLEDPPLLLDASSYSFEEFVKEYRKVYQTAEERESRRRIFNENVHTIVTHNKNQAEGKLEGIHHVLGINPFSDLRADELWKGYTKPPKQHLFNSLSASSTSRRGLTLESLSTETAALPITMDPISSLPKSVDWRAKGVTTPVKSQGRCGSCWAFASTAVLESHIALQTGKLFSLSEQELVSCAPNLQQCGGTGGCDGSTSEIAFDFVRKRGMVEEWVFGYQSYHRKSVNCTLKNTSDYSELPQPVLRGGAVTPSPYFKEAVVSIAGYAKLPSNNYTALMNTVAKLGPVAISVACTPWHLYKSGVFFVPLNETKFSADVNHLVVLEGYGTDQETGEDYWLVRNSWSPRWGENGYIRLRRVDPSTMDGPDQDCGMDVTPADGSACTKDKDGNAIVPPPAKICGTSGILYDTAIPLGGHLV